MQYVASNNTKQRPIMIHRAILGSVERFFGILTENYAGAFPAWLAPVQCQLLPVSESCEYFCEALMQQMRDSGLRAEMVPHRLEQLPSATPRLLESSSVLAQRITVPWSIVPTAQPPPSSWVVHGACGVCWWCQMHSSFWCKGCGAPQLTWMATVSPAGDSLPPKTSSLAVHWLVPAGWHTC